VRFTAKVASTAALLGLAALPLAAQQRPAAPAAAAPAPAAGLPIGSMAPDFALNGATRYGLLKAPVRLADYRGQTVVLAFFYQARTKG
jgi:hypothetical protein